MHHDNGDPMAIMQKKAPGEETPRDAEAVFEKLPYNVILPTGSALDGRLRFEDFNSGRMQTFQMSRVPAGKKDTLPAEVAEKLSKALAQYNYPNKNPFFVTNSVFVVSNVEYEQSTGRLTFSLKLAEAPTVLAKK